MRGRETVLRGRYEGGEKKDVDCSQKSNTKKRRKEKLTLRYFNHTTAKRQWGGEGLRGNEKMHSRKIDELINLWFNVFFVFSCGLWCDLTLRLEREKRNTNFTC